MRRVVTGHDAQGRSAIVSDGVPPRTRHFTSWPGMVASTVWTTEVDESVSRAGADRTKDIETMLPAPGSTRMILMTIPPDSTMVSPDFDGPGFAAEQMEQNPRFLESFDEEGLHTTRTTDYVILLEGELYLVLESGDTRLGVGDVVVQNATRHNWSNRSDAPATVAVVMVGAHTDGQATP